MISLDSIDGTRESPRYIQPKRANPIQNARLDSVRWMASRIEISRAASVSVKTPLSQRSLDSLKAAKPTPKNQEDAEQTGDVESKLPHDTIVQSGIHADRSPIFIMTWLPVGFDILIESVEELDKCATFGALYQCSSLLLSGLDWLLLSYPMPPVMTGFCRDAWGFRQRIPEAPSRS